MQRSDAGFTLIEVLVATAIFAAVAFGAFELVRQLAAHARALTARHLAYGTLERFSAQLRAEARSATAIWSSSTAAGSAPDDCVQLDFFTADAAGPQFWSYRIFPNHGAADAIPGDALQRLAAHAPIAACDPSAPASIVLRGVRAPLTIASIAPNAFTAHRDPFLGSSDAPFVGSGVPAVAPVDLGVLDAGGAPIRGGNALVEVRLDTGQGSRVVDLLPGVFPNGFTEVLRYTCTARCDVGHDTAAPKTLTACAPAWQTSWSEYVTWGDATTNPDGSLTFPGGWFIGGSFTFTYSGTRASDGGTDALTKTYSATNWDVARNYAAYPPDRAAADGSSAGSFAPWNVRSEAAAQWFADFGPYLASGENAPIAAEIARCNAVQAQGASGGFYANG